MTEPRPPLYRLTMLEEDPAAAWLSGPFWPAVIATGLVWAVPIAVNVFYWLFVAPIFYGFLWPLRFLFVGWISLSFLLTLGMITQAKRIAREVKGGLIRKRAMRIATAGAVPIDDWGALEREPDGRIVSLVGWIQARSQLPHAVAGTPAVGLALGCRAKITEYRAPGGRAAWSPVSLLLGLRRIRPVYSFEQPYSGVFEAMHDFDLVDEAGRLVPIQVAGARIVGRSNVIVQSDDLQGQMLISSLDLPLAVELKKWDVLALRDGDPVMVIGFKATVADPTRSALREAPVRPAIVSSPPRPLLLHPIAAERNRRAGRDAAPGSAPG